MSTLQDRMKAVRKKNGINQEELGKAIGLTTGAISAIEKGLSANPATIKKIAEVLKVDYNWLFTGQGVTPDGVVVVTSKRDSQENPWENALVKQLKAENDFLRKIVDKFTGPPSANFRKSLKLASVPNTGAHLGDHLRLVA